MVKLTQELWNFPLPTLPLASSEAGRGIVEASIGRFHFHNFHRLPSTCTTSLYFHHPLPSTCIYFHFLKFSFPLRPRLPSASNFLDQLPHMSNHCRYFHLLASLLPRGAMQFHLLPPTSTYFHLLPFLPSTTVSPIYLHLLQSTSSVYFHLFSTNFRTFPASTNFPSLHIIPLLHFSIIHQLACITMYSHQVNYKVCLHALFIYFHLLPWLQSIFVYSHELSNNSAYFNNFRMIPSNSVNRYTSSHTSINFHRLPPTSVYFRLLPQTSIYFHTVYFHTFIQFHMLPFKSIYSHQLP